MAIACAARLSQHICEAGRGVPASPGILIARASAATACFDSIHRMALGPIFAGKIFPFCFITIACGAISGFHALISSGTTPKMIEREWHAWPVGYGSMLLEGLSRVMALVAAASLDPGVFFAVNSPAGVVGATPVSRRGNYFELGISVTASTDGASGATAPAKSTLFGSTGGAPSLALGMAQIFARDRGRAGDSQLLVPLRHHVRGAVHPDDHRCRHARRPLHAAGPSGPCLQAAGADRLDAGRRG